jgi:hypothetical protein
MSQLCFILAVLSPIALPFGWLLVSYGPGQSMVSPHNGPALVIMALSPLAFIASSIIGVRQVLLGDRKGSGWLAAGLVIDYCWFHVLLTVIIIEQVGRR